MASGSVEELGPGKWRLRWDRPPLAGRRRQRTKIVYGTKKQADQALRKELTNLDGGIDIEPSKLTVGQLAERWLADAAPRTTKPSTLEDYHDTTRVHILPRLGATRAQSLTPAHVDAWLADMARDDVGCRSRQLAYLRLQQALAWATSIELLPRNVMTAVKKPICPVEEARALSHEEAQAFLQEAESDALWPLWLVYLSTGLRRGEALGLAWRDINGERGTLSVRQAVALIGKPKRPVLSDLKSKAARRTLDLDARTLMSLDDHRMDQLHKRPRPQMQNRLLFTTGIETLLNPNNVLRSFYAIRDRAGIDEEVTIHCLRHSHATFLIQAGVPISVVSRRLGHSNPSITMRCYSHILPDAGKLAINAIETSLYPQLTPPLLDEQQLPPHVE